MPDANCAFPVCNVSRYKLHKDIAIFIITKRVLESFRKKVLSGMEKRNSGSFANV